MVNKKFLRVLLLLVLFSILISTIVQGQILNRGLSSIENFFKSGYSRYTKILDFSALFLILTAAFLIALRQIKIPGKDGKGENNRPIKVLAVVLALTSALGIVTTTKFSIFTYPQIWAALAFIVLVWIIYTILLKIGMEKHKFWAFILALILATLLVFLFDWWRGGQWFGSGNGFQIGSIRFGGGRVRTGPIRFGPGGTPTVPTPGGGSTPGPTPTPTPTPTPPIPTPTPDGGGISWPWKWGIGGGLAALALFLVWNWWRQRRGRIRPIPVTPPIPTPPSPIPIGTFIQSLPTTGLSGLVKRIYLNAKALLGSTGSATARALRFTLVEQGTNAPLNQATITLTSGQTTQTFNSGTTNTITIDLDHRTNIENKAYTLNCAKIHYKPYENPQFNPHAQSQFTLALVPMDILIIGRLIEQYQEKGILQIPANNTINLHNTPALLDHLNLQNEYITFRVHVNDENSIFVNYNENGKIIVGGTLQGLTNKKLELDKMNARYHGIDGLAQFLQWFFDQMQKVITIAFTIKVVKQHNKQPIEGVKILINDLEQQKQIHEVFTNEQGIAAVTLHRKKYQAILSKNGFKEGAAYLEANLKTQETLELEELRTPEQVTIEVDHRAEAVREFYVKLAETMEYGKTYTKDEMTKNTEPGKVEITIDKKMKYLLVNADGFRPFVLQLRHETKIGPTIYVHLDKIETPIGGDDKRTYPIALTNEFLIAVMDDFNNAPLTNATIELKEGLRTALSGNTNETGHFIFDRKQYDKTYELLVTKEGYITHESLLRPLSDLTPYEVSLIAEHRQASNRDKPGIIDILRSKRIAFAVFEKDTHTKLSGVDVNNAIATGSFITTTDADGKAIFSLPHGPARIIFSHKEYEPVTWEGNIPYKEDQPVLIFLKKNTERQTFPTPPIHESNSVTFIVKNQSGQVQEKTEIREQTSRLKVIARTDASGQSTVALDKRIMRFSFNKRNVGSARIEVDGNKTTTEPITVILEGPEKIKGEEFIEIQPFTPNSPSSLEGEFTDRTTVVLGTINVSHGFRFIRKRKGVLNLGCKLSFIDPNGNIVKKEKWAIHQTLTSYAKNAEDVRNTTVYQLIKEGEKTQVGKPIGAIQNTYSVPPDAQLGDYKIRCEIVQWDVQDNILASREMIITLTGRNYYLQGPEEINLTKDITNIKIKLTNESSSARKSFDIFVITPVFYMGENYTKTEGVSMEFLSKEINLSTEEIEKYKLQKHVKDRNVIKLQRGKSQDKSYEIILEKSVPNGFYIIDLQMCPIDMANQHPIMTRRAAPSSKHSEGNAYIRHWQIRCYVRR